MKLRACHILVLALVAAFSCSRGPRLIPKDDMALIYHDMFIQDQQVRSDYTVRRLADTSLVYASIFQGYGYDTDDYIYSVRHYIEDPTKLAKIMENTESMLRREADELKRWMDFCKWRDEYMGIYAKKPEKLLPDPPRRASDTLAVRMLEDSIAYFPPVDTAFLPGPLKPETVPEP